MALRQNDLVPQVLQKLGFAKGNNMLVVAKGGLITVAWSIKSVNTDRQ